MAEKANSLSHTKWMCKYHIVFTPKYRRKVIYNQYRKSLGEIFRRLCSYKGVEIIEGYKRQSKNVQKWEFKNVQFYSLNISFKR